MKNKNIASIFQKIVDLPLEGYINLVMMNNGRCPAEIMLDADFNLLLPHRILKMYSIKRDKKDKKVYNKKCFEPFEKMPLEPYKLYDAYMRIL